MKRGRDRKTGLDAAIKVQLFITYAQLRQWLMTSAIVVLHDVCISLHGQLKYFADRSLIRPAISRATTVFSGRLRSFARLAFSPLCCSSQACLCNRMTGDQCCRKQVDHPNCIRLYAVYVTPKSVFIITELVQGGELLDRSVSCLKVASWLRSQRHSTRKHADAVLGAVRVTAQGNFPERVAADLIIQILDGVSYLHNLGARLFL